MKYKMITIGISPHKNKRKQFLKDCLLTSLFKNAWQRLIKIKPKLIHGVEIYEYIIILSSNLVGSVTEKAKIANKGFNTIPTIASQ